MRGVWIRWRWGVQGTESVHGQLLGGRDGDLPGLLHLQRVHLLRRRRHAGLLGGESALFAGQRGRVAWWVGEGWVLWFGGGCRVEVDDPLGWWWRRRHGCVRCAGLWVRLRLNDRDSDARCSVGSCSCCRPLGSLAVPHLATNVRFPDDLRRRQSLAARLATHPDPDGPPIQTSTTRKRQPTATATALSPQRFDAVPVQSSSDAAYRSPAHLSKALRGALKRQGEGSCLGCITIARHMRRGNAERAHS